MADTSSKVDSTSVPPSYTTKPSSSSSGISLCLSYFRTGPGITKLVQLLLGILCMSCAAPAWTNGTHWFLFVVVTAFVATSLWCFIYLLSLREAINLPIDWLLTELILTSLFAVLYIIASIVQIVSTVTKPRPPQRLSTAYMIAGVFGVFNFLAYTVGCFYLYRDWKNAHPNSSFSGSVLKSNP